MLFYTSTINKLQNHPRLIFNSPFWYNYICVLSDFEGNINLSGGYILGFWTSSHERKFLYAPRHKL